MQGVAERLASSRWFERSIIALIVLNGVVLGLETVPTVETNAGTALRWFHWAIVATFAAEAALKIAAVWPRAGRYFRDGWNVFDFSIVVLSLVPAAGPFATIARLARLLRALRLVSVVPELRLIVSTLVRSLPGLGYVVLLLGLIFYVYAVLGVHLFREHDPEHWRNLGIAMLTLFRVVTLEDWTDVMYTAMERHPLAWAYFVSMVVLGSFVVINLLIAVVINNLDHAKAEQLTALRRPPSGQELMNELSRTREQLDRLRAQLEAEVLSGPSSGDPQAARRRPDEPPGGLAAPAAD